MDNLFALKNKPISSESLSPTTNPRFICEKIGEYDDLGEPQDVFVSGSYIFLANGDEGLRIINLNEFNNPSKIGQFFDGGYAKGVVVKGDYAFLADDSDGLEIIDISDPFNPMEIGQINDGTVYAYGVEVYDDYAFLGGMVD